VSAKSGQVLDQQDVDFAVLDRELYLVQSLALEGHTRYVVVKALSDDVITILLGIVHKYLTLILKTVHLGVFVA
jgi:glycerol-3-phosphate responsive antiterminator